MDTATTTVKHTRLPALQQHLGLPDLQRACNPPSAWLHPAVSISSIGFQQQEQQQQQLWFVPQPVQQPQPQQQSLQQQPAPLVSQGSLVIFGVPLLASGNAQPLPPQQQQQSQQQHQQQPPASPGVLDLGQQQQPLQQLDQRAEQSMTATRYPYQQVYGREESSTNHPSALRQYHQPQQLLPSNFQAAYVRLSGGAADQGRSGSAAAGVQIPPPPSLTHATHHVHPSWQIKSFHVPAGGATGHRQTAMAGAEAGAGAGTGAAEGTAAAAAADGAKARASWKAALTRANAAVMGSSNGEGNNATQGRNGGATDGSSRSSAPAAAASKFTAALLGINYPGGSSRNSSEQYFRQHAPLVDPFWGSATADDVGVVAVTHLPPSSVTGNAAGVGSSVSCTLNFSLSQSMINMVRSKTAHLQLLCLLVNDRIPHRCHWPIKAQLMVNSVPVSVCDHKRFNSGKQLAANQVDSALDISNHASALMAVRLVGTSSSGGYVLGARLVRRQGGERVKRMMRQQPSLQEALAGIKEQLAGDGDVEVAATALSLRCPLSGCRIATPAHFASSGGLNCFDLDNFLEMTARSGKWQCPFSRALSSVSQLVAEPFLGKVLEVLKAAGLADTVNEVEVVPDGSWRPKGAAPDVSFSVLTPPTAAQLQAALNSSDKAAAAAAAAAAAGARVGCKRQADEDAGGQRPAKQQRMAAEGIDLTLDSDDEQDEAPPAAGTGAAAGAGTSAAAAAAFAAAAAAAGSGVAPAAAGALQLRHPLSAFDAAASDERARSDNCNDSRCAVFGDEWCDSEGSASGSELEEAQAVELQRASRAARNRARKVRATAESRWPWQRAEARPPADAQQRPSAAAGGAVAAATGAATGAGNALLPSHGSLRQLPSSRLEGLGNFQRRVPGSSNQQQQQQQRGSGAARAASPEVIVISDSE